MSNSTARTGARELAQRETWRSSSETLVRRRCAAIRKPTLAGGSARTAGEARTATACFSLAAGRPGVSQFRKRNETCRIPIRQGGGARYVDEGIVRSVSFRRQVSANAKPGTSRFRSRLRCCDHATESIDPPHSSPPHRRRRPVRATRAAYILVVKILLKWHPCVLWCRGTKRPEK